MAGPNGFCTECQTAKQQRIDSNRPSSSKRGYDGQWAKIRIQAFLRDEWRCVDCGWQPDIVTLMHEAGSEASTADVLEELRRRYHTNEKHLHADHRLTIEARPDLRLELSNIQTLCSSCHARKTMRESVLSGLSHEQRMAVVTIVYGPPCGGKSTYVHQHKSDGDVILDYDQLAVAMGCEMHLPVSTAVHWLVLAAYDAVIARLAQQNLAVRAWVIGTLPDESRLDNLKVRLSANVVLMNPGIEECKRRAMTRPDRDKAEKGIEEWFHASRLSLINTRQPTLASTR